MLLGPRAGRKRHPSHLGYHRKQARVVPNQDFKVVRKYLIKGYLLILYGRRTAMLRFSGFFLWFSVELRAQRIALNIRSTRHAVPTAAPVCILAGRSGLRIMDFQTLVARHGWRFFWKRLDPARRPLWGATLGELLSGRLSFVRTVSAPVGRSQAYYLAGKLNRTYKRSSRSPAGRGQPPAGVLEPTRKRRPIARRGRAAGERTAVLWGLAGGRRLEDGGVTVYWK